MSSLRRSLLLLVILVGPSVSQAAVYDPSLKWKTIETRHFSIHFYEGEEAVAQKLRVITEEAYAFLSKEFDARPWGRTQVVVTDFSDNPNGFTVNFPYNLITLRVVPPTPDNTLAHYDDWLRELFIHEYTHVIHITDTRYPMKFLKYLFGTIVNPNGTAPGWITEGMATYYETEGTTQGRGRSSFKEMLLRTDILQGRFLKLDQMAGAQYNWPSWLAQYLYGVGFWQYLSETYGQDKVTEFSHKYGSSLWLYALNHQAKRVFKDEKGRGKSFYTLWKEWKVTLEKKYEAVKKEVETKGLVEGLVFLKPKEGETFAIPVSSPDGKSLAYLATSVHHPEELRLRDLENGKEKVLQKGKDIDQVSFSPDGEKIVFSMAGKHKRYYFYSDLHEVTLKTGKVKQITQGKRLRDPDFSPDGKKIVAVFQKTGPVGLSVYDIEKKEWTELPSFSISEAQQIAHPRWLPDGKSVVVAVHDEKQWDLWIVDMATGQRRVLTSDAAVEDRPFVDFKKNTVTFSSDVTGISNIFQYDLKSHKTTQVTNVLTGAFGPAVSPEGKILFQYYMGDGFEVREVSARGEGTVSASFRTPSPLAGEGRGEGEEVKIKNYNPFRTLLIPRYLFPNVALLDNSVFATVMTGSNDPLERHFWFADGTYRSDAGFFGFDVGYTYNRFLTPVSVGYSDYAVNFGDVSGSGTDFFEGRRRGSVGISLPLSSQVFGINYFFENRREHSGLPAGITSPTLGNYAGIGFQYAISSLKTTAAAISPEEGGRLSLNAEVTDGVLGSAEALEQEVFWADTRTFFRVPATNHHVLALRAAGGAAFGDQLLQGNFGLGGSLGESPFNASSSRVFTLRGLPFYTFSSDRVWVASAEYRLPLFRAERGIGTWPIFLNTAHFALFTDVGDTFRRADPSFRPLVGVGGELRGDFVLGYYVPIMGRLGYGIIVTNRDRVVGTDPYTGGDARNGVLVLEVGTSF